MVDYWEKFEYGATYHLYNKAIGDRKLFLDHMDYSRFLKKFRRYFDGYTTLFAYCLIPNHFHFMFRVNKIEDINQNKLAHEDSHAARSFLKNPAKIDDFLTDQLRRWYSGTALYLNKKYDSTGQVFLEKTKRVSVKSEEKLFSLLCYIHHNPIHHGLSKAYEDWSYSSYKSYLVSRPEPGIEEMLGFIGESDPEKKKVEFLKMHEGYRLNFDR